MTVSFRRCSLYHQMFNVDKSVQPSALSDNEFDCETLFLDGKMAMVIDHPSFPQQVQAAQAGFGHGRRLASGRARAPRRRARRIQLPYPGDEQEQEPPRSP